MVVVVDVVVVVGDALLELFDVLSQPVDLKSECLESNEDVGGLVNVVLIIRLDNDILTEVKEYSYLFISVTGLIGKCSALLKCQCHIRIFGETMNESFLK